MRIGRLQIEVGRGRRRRTVRADLTAKVPGPRVQVNGSFLRAVLTALDFSRRDQRSWAVLQAARGRYELVPLHLVGADGSSDVDDLSAIWRVAGVSQVSIARLTGQLVAITGERTPYVFRGDVVSLDRLT